jgi:hypothetical protein
MCVDYQCYALAMLHLWKGAIDSHLLDWVSLRTFVDMMQTGDLFQPGDDHLQPDIGFLSSKKCSFARYERRDSHAEACILRL